MGQEAEAGDVDEMPASPALTRVLLVRRDGPVWQDLTNGLDRANVQEVASAEKLLEALDRNIAGRLIVASIADFCTAEILRKLDWRMAARRPLRMLLVVDPSMVDQVGASLGYDWVDYACAPISSVELVRRIGGTQRRFAAPDALTLAELGEEAARIAHALSKLAAQLPLASVPITDAAVDAPSVRRLIRLRRMRDVHFPAELFADPAWDILLDLTAARLEGAAVSASSLCIAAAVPTTTGLRWIKGMTERGFLVREPDPQDGRRVLVTLSDAAFGRMIECLSAFRREGVPV